MKERQTVAICKIQIETHRHRGVCVYAQVCMCVHISTQMCVTDVHVRMCMYALLCVSTCTGVCTHVCVCNGYVCAYAQLSAQACVCVCVWKFLENHTESINFGVHTL